MRQALISIMVLLLCSQPALALQGAAGTASAALQVSDAWMRALPPGQPTAAAYLTLKNVSESPILLVEISASVASRVEIHESVQEDGMWRMRAMPRMELAAGQSLSLEPGGIHLMMFGMQRSPQPGQQFQFEFTLASGETVSATANVRATGASSAHRHH